MDFEHRICVNEHGFYCVPEAFVKREIPRTLARGEVYEPNTLKLLARRVADGDIVTGGAFIGDFLPALSAAMAPGARIISFEPNPLSFAAAQQTIALNGLTNVDLRPVAVSDAPGTLHLELARPGGGASAGRARILGADESADGAASIPVEVTTIDDLTVSDPTTADRPTSILHLDVEGHEKQALLGAARLIRKSAPMIVLEAARPKKRARFADFLADRFPDLGYRLCGAMERNAFYLPQG